MIKVHGMFDYDVSVPFDPTPETISIPEFSILYIKNYDKSSQWVEKSTKKKVIAQIVFENDTVDNFNVFQFINN